MNEQIQRFVEELASSSPLNRLPEQYGGGRFFDRPLIGVSRGDDPIFNRFKEVVGPEHLAPSEMWVQSGLEDKEDLGATLRIVSIIFPYVNQIREESISVTKMPAEIYSVGRNFADAFIGDVLNETVNLLSEQGYHGVAGVLSPAFRVITEENPFRIYSVWSERHMAFAAGLGTFSLHEGMITEIGCNVRFGSFITDAPLRVTPRKSDDPYANCLFYSEGTCRECEERCPGDAITEEAGHDKLKCYRYGRVVAEEMTQRIGSILKPRKTAVDRQARKSYAVGCAFCQFGVPCMDTNPTSRSPKKDQPTA